MSFPTAIWTMHENSYETLNQCFFHIARLFVSKQKIVAVLQSREHYAKLSG